MDGEKHPRHLALERALLSIQTRIPELPYERMLAIRLLIHAHKHADRLNNELLKSHKLSYVSYSVLMVLFGAGENGVSASELSLATSEKPTNITRICDDFHARGWLERQPALDDRRRIELRLTAEGERLCRTLQPQLWPQLERMFVDFTEDEILQFQDFLGRLLRAGEREAG